MSFKNIKLCNSYNTDTDNVLGDFYLPVLREAISYDRITGFFTSSSLIITGKHFLQMIESNGLIRMLTCPRLSSDDINILNNSLEKPEDFLVENMKKELDDNSFDDFQLYKKLFGHLIASKKLIIKIVFVKNNDGSFMDAEEVDHSSIFHQKVGIIRDRDGNVLSFSGSINESVSAWYDNIEEFKVFKSWEAGSLQFVKTDVLKFENFWQNKGKRTVTMNLPEAIQHNLIEETKNESLDSVVKKLKKKLSTELNNSITMKKEISLFEHQKKCMEEWIEKDFKMMFSLATGTGKTRTALACLSKIINDSKKPVLVVISVPQNVLAKQWINETNALEISTDSQMIADGTNVHYEKQLREIVGYLNYGIINNAIVFAVHDTVCSNKFISIINSVNDEKVDMLFIGDEVHALGSSIRRKALLDKYKYRIGLSATPTRWFDEEGTDSLIDYFGNQVFEFGIDKALNTINPITNRTILCSYNYIPIKVMLTENETDKYKYYTDKIRKLVLKKDKTKDENQRLENLIRSRSNIIKQANNKFEMLEKLVDRIGADKLRNTIIFTSPDKIASVVNMLTGKGVKTSAFTQKQSNIKKKKYGNKSEREIILEYFKLGKIQVLVAIKCLDEGIDIPTADTAILMSSTTNPREYIQRIGRVIRQYPKKKYANIYDFFCISSDNEISKDIQKKESIRFNYIAENAINAYDALKKLRRD